MLLVYDEIIKSMVWRERNPIRVTKRDGDGEKASEYCLSPALNDYLALSLTKRKITERRTKMLMNDLTNPKCPACGNRYIDIKPSESKPDHAIAVCKVCLMTWAIYTGDEFCRHWIELDTDGGSVENCRSANLQCTCSGTKEQCDYPLHYEAKK